MARVLLTNFEARKDNLIKLRVSSYIIFWVYLPEVYPSQRCIAGLHITPKMRVNGDHLRLRRLLGGLSLLF